MIYTLHPRLNHPDAGEVGKSCYFYDDPAHGVYCEQLVKSTSEAIHDITMSSGLWNDDTNKPEHVTLNFCAVSDDALRESNPDLPIVRLRRCGRNINNEMTLYLVQGWFPQSFVDEMDFMDEMSGSTMIELCDHLMDFFPQAPELFYCQVSLPTKSPEPVA